MKVISVLMLFLLVSFNIANAGHGCEDCHEVKIEKADCHDHEDHQENKTKNKKCFDCTLCISFSLFILNAPEVDLNIASKTIDLNLPQYKNPFSSSHILEILRPPIA